MFDSDQPDVYEKVYLGLLDDLAAQGPEGRRRCAGS
jgi:hypothetical protein